MRYNNDTDTITRTHEAFNALADEYSHDTACQLTSRSFARHGVTTTPTEVSDWHRLNTAIAEGRVNIGAEQRFAERMAHDTVDAALSRLNLIESEEGDDDDDMEAEMDSMGDIFGYESDDDNDEAALDTILKNNERID
nr:hypothetical protein [uncultured Halomonas sp.]